MNKALRKETYFRRRSIRYPLARLIIVAVLLGLGLALVSDAYVTLGNVRKEIRRTMLAAANAVGTAAGAAVVFRDEKVAVAVLRMFEAYPEVTGAALYTSDGLRLATHGDASQLPSYVPAMATRIPEISPLATTTTLQQPIQVDGTPVGTIHIQARLQAYWSGYLADLATTFAVAFIAGTLALVLAMRFLERVILPVRLMADAARDARVRKDFVPRDIPAGDDEIGDLVRNFNALLAEVEAGRRALQLQHDQLEELVRTRTNELLAAKELADAASAAKSRFLAAASHDLRQPIHAMRLFLETLGESPLNDEQRRIINYLSLSTRNLADILNALLDFSRLDSGTVRSQVAAVQAYDLADRIEAEFAPLALARRLRFKLFFPGRDLVLRTDGRLLAGLLRNLIDNAIKYTPHGGILVAFRRRRDHGLIQVWDTGIGIGKDHMDAVFDEYFQVGNPQRDRTKGLGLGLANAKRMAGILGCPIVCRSRLGKGSVFEVRVPLADAPAPGTAVPPERQEGTAGEGSSLAGLRVHVVEDDEMAARATEASLGAHGMVVTTFASAEEALAAPGIGDADFFIVDYRLPGMSGVEFLDTLQQRQERSIDAILLTGETRQSVAEAGASSPWKVMFKPMDTATLLEEIKARSHPGPCRESTVPTRTSPGSPSTWPCSPTAWPGTRP